MNIRLSDSVKEIKGVGPEIYESLKSCGIETVSDLLDFWPRKFEDYSKVVNICDCAPGDLTILSKISGVKSKYIRRGLHVTEALATDDTGSVRVVWFNQPYRKNSIKPNSKYYISGNFDVHGGRLSIANPTIYEEDKSKINSLIVPVYPENKKLKSGTLRRLIKAVIHLAPGIKDTLPINILDSEGLITRGKAIELLQVPKTSDDLVAARERLAFEELFEMQLATQIVKKEIETEKSPIITFDSSFVSQVIKSLPFKLTDDQRRVLWQIFKDLEKDSPMNRLVEGDVGSGKTVVAALAAMMVMKNGYQVMFMAPTEILATQHANTLAKLFEKTEFSNSISLLTGGVKKSARKILHEKIVAGESKIVVGTHALIQDSIVTNNVGLVIIDEQHRFGVNQRQKLRQKAGVFPHFMAMTATPIPRTLTLTLYGEVDLSVIESMPAGRKTTITEIKSFAVRHDLYQKLNKEIEEGQQVFIVCPLIEESEVLEVQAAESLYKEIQTKQLKTHKIALLHGKMKPEEKEKIMVEFKNKSIDVLVSTTVIEVGVDVPDANIMVIEGAERFGLAQIHQLRGRVGRGGKQGYCYLIPSQGIEETKRLKAVASTSSGFKLAELDLKLRGPGAIYGVRQSGVLDLRIASFEDRKMLIRAKDAAIRFIESGEGISNYPHLEARVKHFQSLTKLN